MDWETENEWPETVALSEVAFLSKTEDPSSRLSEDPCLVEDFTTTIDSIVNTEKKETVYTLEEIGLMRNQKIDELVELCCISKDEVIAFLKRYNWKTITFQNDWLQGNEEKMRKTHSVSKQKEAPLSRLSEAPSSRLSEAPSSRLSEAPSLYLTGDRKFGDCSTAFCEQNVEGFSLNCGHFFCRNCWEMYIDSEVKLGRQCLLSTCMGTITTEGKTRGCKELIPESVFLKFLIEEERQKYRKWTIDAYLENEKVLKWCSRKGCEYILSKGQTDVSTCKCGFSFCFICGLEDHSPLPCDLTKRWLVRETSEDATQIWLSARTKQCPNCKVPIEKNKACNHMSCVKCAFHFCWLCLQDWTKHNGYHCSAYVNNTLQNDVKKLEENAISKQLILQQYAYYYKLYKEMQKNIQTFEKTFDSLAIVFFEHLRKRNKEIDRFTHWCSIIRRRILRAYRVLQWSHPYNYYLRKCGEKNCFELHQQIILEKVDKLHHLFELKATSMEELLSMSERIENATNAFLKQLSENPRFFLELAYEPDENDKTRIACVNCNELLVQEGVLVKFCVKCNACIVHSEMNCNACSVKKIVSEPTTTNLFEWFRNRI